MALSYSSSAEAANDVNAASSVKTVSTANDANEFITFAVMLAAALPDASVQTPPAGAVRLSSFGWALNQMFRAQSLIPFLNQY